MNANETAILLIEFQNEFCSPDGINYNLVKDVLEKNCTIPNTVDLVAKARSRGIRVFHVPICFSADYREMSPEAFGIAKVVVDTGTFKKGTKNAEIIDELKPLANEVVIEGKRAPDGFSSTNLDFHLRAAGIKNVAVAGFLTNICVESTIRTAFEKGYRVVALTDCTAATSMEIQEFIVKNNFPVFSLPMTHDEFLAQVN